MLSICTLKSAKQAANYYKDGDYYTKEGEGPETSWFGAGAEKLGLNGQVDFEVFRSLLEGKLPDGTQMHLGYDKNGRAVHRPGYDLTFSACKSASLLYYLGGDERIRHAFQNSVESTLSTIQSNAATRVKKEGKVEVVKTQNLVAALFPHNTSRELDPAMHTHCVIMNMTEHEGEMRNLYGDDFYQSKKSLGLQQRLRFARNLMKLGYEIEQISEDGLFEIKGVDTLTKHKKPGLLRHFSKRRQDIEAILEERGLDKQQKVQMTINRGTKHERVINTVASSMANFVSRVKKKPFPCQSYNNTGPRI